MDNLLSPWKLIAGFDVKKIDGIAQMILEKVGLKVPREDIREKLSSTGKVKIEGERVLIPEGTLGEFWPQPQKRKSTPERKNLYIYASEWPLFFLDPESLEIRPFDREHLIAYTKLLDSYFGTDIGGTCPGRLQDVPPLLREIETYYILCRYSRSARFPLVGDENIFDWMRRIAEVMGHELYTSVFVFSPLTFYGNSLNVALKFNELFQTVGIASMPILGISAPLEWNTAWGQAVAESIGGYILLRLLGFDNVVYDISIYPGSMESGAVAFGSPEHLFCILTRAKVREFYGLSWNPAETMLTTAILPGPQASAEKSALTAIAALAGCRVIEGAGTLGIDEIFSPQQFMIDVEIKGYIDRILEGFEIVEESNSLELILEGIKDGHFLATPWTSSHWRKYYWLPQLFHQLKLPQRLAKREDILAEAWEKARKRIEENSYELEVSKLKELDKILKRARRELI
ncbi:trimethylamine methyltransferase family protein [bacterium]|nr:trimethylamine methyltransferase family protein [bacterium]